jgi:phosphatidylglycerophosphatase A
MMATPLDTNTSKRNYRIIPPTPDSVWQNPLHFIAFGFGVGTIPFAPGTFGTLIAIPFYLAMRSLSNVSYLIITLLVIVASMWICDQASRDVGVQDHQGMCLDEVVGFLVTMFNAPHSWPWILAGFVLFRLFDIWKPWPINYIDAHVHGGVGMMLDDVLAGVFACAILQIFAWIF